MDWPFLEILTGTADGLSCSIMDYGRWQAAQRAFSRMLVSTAARPKGIPDAIDLVANFACKHRVYPELGSSIVESARSSAVVGMAGKGDYSAGGAGRSPWFVRAERK
jgi:hypothetical protein